MAHCSRSGTLPPALRLAAVAGRSPRHRFVVALPLGLPRAEGATARLAQVLRNRSENAVTDTSTGGEVRTTALLEVRSENVVLLTTHGS